MGKINTLEYSNFPFHFLHENENRLEGENSKIFPFESLILPTSCMDLQKICRNYDNSSVKVARPAQILGGGAGGGKIPVKSLISEKHTFCKYKLPCRNS
ncbi:hypothetical protein A0128_14465 [Leptospira tipperaryensis]|uniref:Uncharacterized protein n=1 Tax=Leptospira tipperaryensis TaxID=2564040 RepID=A0A1D7UZC4_9LEPT|nr:hypothetical protein A0128_14465 [Leptospira tipperaryensis]